MIIKSASAMKALAGKMAKEILAEKIGKQAAVLGLVGDLGAGKTTFAQGFARALGIKERVLSPTFLILKKFKIQNSKFTSFYHVDAYRLHDPKELMDLGFAEVLEDPENIVLIEWADKVKKVLPPNTRWLRFQHGEKESERIVG